MKQNIINSFRITNLLEFDFSYKLIEVQFSDSDTKAEKDFNQELGKVQLAIAAESGVAVPVFRNGKPFIAIPQNAIVTKKAVSGNPLTINLKHFPKVYHIKANDTSFETQEIILKFINFVIRRQLTRKHGLWEFGSQRYFPKNSKPMRDGIEESDGFEFKLIHGSNLGLEIVLDIASVYTEDCVLSDYINLQNVGNYRKALFERKCLYQNGDDWYDVEIAGFGKSIDSESIEKDNNRFIVYDYILRNTRCENFDIKTKVKPEHVSLLYKYPGRDMKPHAGSTSLAKLILPSNSPAYGNLHKRSIKSPPSRFRSVQYFINKYFQNLTFQGKKLIVAKEPMAERLGKFKLTVLKYAGNRLLAVDNQGRNGVLERDYPYQRRKMIERFGILKNDEFDPQYLLFPSEWDEGLISAFKDEFTKLAKCMAPNFPGFEMAIPYTFSDGITALDQVKEIQALLTKKGVETGFALFILPEIEDSKYVSHFHDLLKKKLYKDIRFQCASAKNLENFFASYPSKSEDILYEYLPKQESMGRYKSYLFYLALEYFTLNRKWAYCLANPLHYDIYIGIDVHGRHAGFSLFFKDGDNKIFFDYMEVPKKPRSVRANKVTNIDEAVKKLAEMLERNIPDCAPNPNGIIFMMDGRSHGEGKEIIGRLIDYLHDKKLLNKETIKWGVVDVLKDSSVPLRIATTTNGQEGLENPKAGTYRVNLNKKEPEGFLFNTGFPFKIRGSASPLQLVLRAGNVDFVKVMQDIFDQSMLAFSAPDLSNSLPIVLKLIDVFLGHAGTSFDEDFYNQEPEVLKLFEDHQMQAA
jgi:hypothetical protein